MVTSFQHKKVLVTGGGGFVGAHLVEQLIAEKAVVYATVQSVEPRSYYMSSKLHDKAISVALDICDFEKLYSFIIKNRIETIFHLAAQAFVDVAFMNPKETLSTNIMGTVNILECSRLSPYVRSLIFASSDKAYGVSSDGIYHENDPLQGKNIYEVSKSCADLIAQSYYHTYRLPVTIARFGNIYGEGDWDETRLIPGLMQSIVNKNQFIVRSDGTPTRDYVYVKDVVEGYILLAKNIDKTQGEVYNFGSEDAYSVQNIIKTTQQALKTTISCLFENRASHEIQHQHLDYSKATKQLNWKPRTRLKAILPQLYAWYRKHS